MSIENGPEKYLHEASEDAPPRQSLENMAARGSLDGRSTVAEKADYEKKEDEPPSLDTTLLDHEDFPDGGLRAWLIVFGVSHDFDIPT
jgi:hypothetical protein